MTDMKLYACVVPERGQERRGSTGSTNQSVQGVLGSSTGSVETIATVPGDQTFTVQFAAPNAEKLVTQLDELARSGDIDEVPFFGVSESTSRDGYYTLSQTDTGAMDPHSTQFQRFDGTLSYVGTRAEHRRAVKTDISEESHPWGNDQTAHIGAPADATKVRWLDEETGQRAEPSLVETRTGEFGDVEVYDARDADLDADNPTLIYDIAYSDAAWTDPRVWDTRGEASRTDGDAVAWAKVFATDHDFAGEAILSNGLIRLRFDEDDQSLTVEEWDDGASSWTSVSLGSSDWEFFDLDLRRVGLASVHAVVEFRDPTQSPTEYYTIDCRVKRGWESILFDERDGEGGVPTGLEDLLDPIASESNYDPGEDVGLVTRSDL